MSQGDFVLSLDIELMWGLQDKKRILDHSPDALGMRKAIPRILDMFAEHDIHCTWAILGFLFCVNKQRIYSIMPAVRPHYTDINRSSYAYLTNIGDDEYQDPYHYAGSLINLIRETPGQEIATHTFSKYYCLAEGQSKEEFRQDILAAIEAAEPYDIKYQSITFPGGEINPDYFEVLGENSITVYRGTEKNWIRDAGLLNRFGHLQRALDFIDIYVNVSGSNCRALSEAVLMNHMFDISASRCLAPYSPRLGWLEGLKIRRIKEQMRYAAQNGEIFHLWWQPHHFGRYLEQNLKNLTAILEYYAVLKNAYGFQSLTMEEAAWEAGRRAQEAAQQISPNIFYIKSNHG